MLCLQLEQVLEQRDSSTLTGSLIETDDYLNLDQQSAELGEALEQIQEQISDYEATLAYADNPTDFINDECWIFNPNLEPSTVRFNLYGYQRDFLKELHNAYLNEESMLTEKSRQMGLSWLYTAFMLWALLYDPDFSGLVLSYKDRYVDDGGSESTFDSLLGKVRFMYEHLRPEIQQNLSFKYMHVRNLRNNTFMVGETAHTNAGRGGSYRIGLWDETAQTLKSESVFMAFHQACRCRCYNSTPRGKGNVFSRLRFSPKSTVHVVSIHWTQHPEKGKDAVQKKDGSWTSPWYEYQCQDLTQAQIAQELDIDYEISIEGRVYEKFKSGTHVTKEPIVFNPEWQTIIAWDLGVADMTFGTVQQLDVAGNVILVDEVVGTDEDIRFYIDLVCGVRPSELDFFVGDKKAHFERFLANAIKYHYADLIHVAGPDAGQRTINSKLSVRQQFQQAGQLGIGNGRIINNNYRNMQMISLTGYKILDRIVATRKIIDPSRQKFWISPVCENSIEHMSNYAWTRTTEGMNRDSPDHNWACLEGNTKVRTLSGWLSIKDIKEGDYVWGYSENEKRLIPTVVKNAGITGENVPLIEVGLDSGKSIKCTLEHKFMLRTTKYKRADELKVGDSLMPFYERLNRKYILVDLNDGSQGSEHRIVFARFKEPLTDPQIHIDHVDHNRYNNHPNNLQALSMDEHCRKTFQGKDMLERTEVDVTPEGREFYNDRMSYYKFCKNCNEEFLGTYKTVYCSKECSSLYRQKRDSLGLTPSRTKEAKLEKNRKQREKYHLDKLKNHKVRFIRNIENGDVYDLCVPETGNFVAEGVVVHNSHGADSVGYGVLYFTSRKQVTRKPDFYGERTTRNIPKGLGSGMKIGR